MIEDLENKVIAFLGTIPKKRYANIREICMGINGGRYPSIETERVVKKICLQLWEYHLADEESRKKPYYRLSQKERLNFKGRVALKKKYKDNAIEILAKNGAWMLRTDVVNAVVGQKMERRDSKIYLAHKAIIALRKLGVVDAKGHGSTTKIRLRPAK